MTHNNAHPKLTPQDVREIRLFLELDIPQQVIADNYGVGQQAISHIKTGRTWQGVE